MTVFAQWADMTLAFVAFLISHVAPARPAMRRRLQARLGCAGYAVVYSGVSLAVLAWLFAAVRDAPHIQLWDFELWQLLAPNLVMPFVCVLIAFGVAAPNPFSIAGRNAQGCCDGPRRFPRRLALDDLLAPGASIWHSYARSWEVPAGLVCGKIHRPAKLPMSNLLRRYS